MAMETLSAFSVLHVWMLAAVGADVAGCLLAALLMQDAVERMALATGYLLVLQQIEGHLLLGLVEVMQ